MFSQVWLMSQWTWNTSWLLLGLISFALYYLYLLKRYSTIKIYHSQPLLFFFSLALLYVLIGSPLYTISQLTFSTHMIQMSMVYFFVPPAFLLGIPSPIFHHILKNPLIQKLRTYSFPAKLSLYAFAILFFIYHLPFVLNLLSNHTHILNGYLTLLFILSFSMWWPLVAPIPELRYSHHEKKQYAYLSGFLLMPACLNFIISAFIGGSANPVMIQLAAHLCVPPELLTSDVFSSPLPTKYDQFTGGLSMLGMHKLGLMLTFHIGKKVKNHTT